jgi:hypothetical protein
MLLRNGARHTSTIQGVADDKPTFGDLSIFTERTAITHLATFIYAGIHNPVLTCRTISAAGREGTSKVTGFAP